MRTIIRLEYANCTYCYSTFTFVTLLQWYKVYETFTVCSNESTQRTVRSIMSWIFSYYLLIKYVERYLQIFSEVKKYIEKNIDDIKIQVATVYSMGKSSKPPKIGNSKAQNRPQYIFYFNGNTDIFSFKQNQAHLSRLPLPGSTIYSISSV